MEPGSADIPSGDCIAHGPVGVRALDRTADGHQSQEVQHHEHNAEYGTHRTPYVLRTRHDVTRLYPTRAQERVPARDWGGQALPLSHARAGESQCF